MPFIPDETPAKEVPFFENVKSGDGCQGHASRKNVEQLKREVVVALGRLGGSGVLIQRGKFHIGAQKRVGFQITYMLSNGDNVVKCKLNIAALPTKKDKETRINETLKMALYMLRNALDGAWFLEQLSPGYAALVPFMLVGNSDLSLTEIWSQGAELQKLLPPGDSENAIDAEFREIEE